MVKYYIVYKQPSEVVRRPMASQIKVGDASKAMLRMHCLDRNGVTRASPALNLLKSADINAAFVCAETATLC